MIIEPLDVYKSLVTAYLLFQIRHKRWKEKVGKSAFYMQMLYQQRWVSFDKRVALGNRQIFKKSIISCLYNLPLKFRGSHVCKMGLKDCLWLGGWIPVLSIELLVARATQTDELIAARGWVTAEVTHSVPPVSLKSELLFFMPLMHW